MTRADKHIDSEAGGVLGVEAGKQSRACGSVLPWQQLNRVALEKSYCTPESYSGTSSKLYRNPGGGRFEDAGQKAGKFVTIEEGRGLVAKAGARSAPAPIQGLTSRTWRRSA